MDIPHQRLHNQHISSPHSGKPADIVSWLAAVQSQDYSGAKWGVGQRLLGATDNAIEEAFTNGDILRTHLLRPTWHFVAREDIRWTLMLTAPRVHAANAYWYRKFGLDDATLARTNTLIAEALQGGKQLTRDELMQTLGQADIPKGETLRGSYIMMHAELEGTICSGARRGKQFTYALVDERAPQAKTLDYDEALAELTRRFYTSRGPATVQDYVWWSGLTSASAKKGVEMLGSQLRSQEIERQTYWSSTDSPATPPTKDRNPTANLLPNYDEYISGYKDRSAIFDPANAGKLDLGSNPAFPHFIAIDGQIIGTWKRTLKKNEVIIEICSFAKLCKTDPHAIEVAAEQYGQFLGLPATLQL